MELWTPVRAHAEWITMFRETLYGRAALSVQMVGDDNSCEVGRWLNRHANSLVTLEEYRVAREIHEQFHRRAAYCLRLAESGRRLEAIEDTGYNGELKRLSRGLVVAFQDLKRTVRRQDLPVSWEIDRPGPALAGQLRPCC